MSHSESIVLAPELDYFESHRMELVERASGKYALIKGMTLIDLFETELEAIRAGYQRFGTEAFLVKQILEADVPLKFTSFSLGV